MAGNSNLGPFRVALVVIGIIFIVGIYPLTIVWPSGWAWHMGGQSVYLQMIMVMYAMLGIFLLVAARNPLANLSLIWFTVWSSVVHGGAVVHLPRASWTSVRRRACFAADRHRARGPDASGGKSGGVAALSSAHGRTRAVPDAPQPFPLRQARARPG